MAAEAGATMMLHGRDAELAIVSTLLDDVEQGGAALIVRGEAGIGKSALLAASVAAARARGMTVLETTGVQSETHLPFAGLHQLLRPLLSAADALPQPQTDALHAAFGLVDSSAPEQFLIGLATLELLADAAAQTPVFVAVEDAHWLDGPTASVLAFVARRVADEPIAALVTVRLGWASVLDAAGIPELQLEPLDVCAAAALVAEQSPELTSAMRDRVVADAAGNPLALVELPHAIPAGRGLTGTFVAPLPLTDRLERAFAGRAQGLPSATRNALLIAAANDGDDVSVVLRAAGEDIGMDVLDEAIEANLIGVEGAALRFRHPLVRSAVYGEATWSERRAAHASLAAALEGDIDRATWHRAAAEMSTNPELADDLGELAARAQRRGATAVALTALDRAATLSEDPALRSGRLLQAGEMAFEIAGPELGAHYLREAERLDLTIVERARLSLLRELFEDQSLTADSGHVRTLVEIVDQVRCLGEIDLATNLLMAVAQRCWWVDVDTASRNLIVAAAARLPKSADDASQTAILAFADPVGRCPDVVERISAVPSADDVDSAASRLIGAAATAVGAYTLAPGFLASSVNGLRKEGRVGLLAQALVSQAWVAAFLGRWTEATLAADEASRLSRETGQPRWSAAADLAAATVAALRGEIDRSEALSAAAECELLPLTAHPTLAFAQLARGTAALSQGAHAEAYGHFQRMFDPADAAYHPFVRQWVIGDLAESAALSGHVDEARLLVDELMPVASRSHAPLLTVSLNHARALLSPPDQAGDCFQSALSADLTGLPYHRARALLAYGAWLRRQRRVAESRTPLRAARQCFDALGARPWSERARIELRASGEASADSPTDASHALSPQELQIAQMAADGFTNREIGQRLYLSHRTVGTHLYRIFPKLGVASRRELQRALEAGAGMLAVAVTALAG